MCYCKKITVSVTIDGKTPANLTLFDDTFDTGLPITMKYPYSSADGIRVPFTFRNFYLDNQPFARSNLAQGADVSIDYFNNNKTIN